MALRPDDSIDRCADPGVGGHRVAREKRRSGQPPAAGALQFAHEQRAVAAGDQDARRHRRAGSCPAVPKRPGAGSASQILTTLPSSRVANAPGSGSNARTARSIARRACAPVDDRLVAVDLCGVGRAAPACGCGIEPADRAQASRGSATIAFRAGCGELVVQRAGGVARCDGNTSLRDHRTGVEPGVHLHDA